MFLSLSAVAAAAIWAYLLLGRGGFWRMHHAPATRIVDAPYPTIVAVIPARNEAAVVGEAIRSLARQKYPGDFQIVLVDDDSSDGTADAARDSAPNAMLTIIRAAPLPPGWSGKLWAVAEGLRHAQALHPDYFLLTDADIVHPAESLIQLVSQSRDYDLVSYMATLECASLAERTLIPAFVFFFFMLYPPAWVRSPRHATAGAAGGCMLIRRTTLERIGGIATIAGSLIDDCALARAVKNSRGRVWLGLNPATRSIRKYATFAEIGSMISRTAFTQLDHSILQLAGTVIGLTLTYLAPPALVIGAIGHVPGYATALGALAWLTMSIMYTPILRYYGVSVLWSPFLPLVATFYLGATIHSAVSHWRGRGGAWKGRVGLALEGGPPGPRGTPSSRC